MTLFALFAAVSGTTVAAPSPLPPSAIEALAAPKSASAPGCAVAVVDRGQLVFAKGYGLADLDTKRPITADTSFNIASLTKQFTGAAIALLIADGKIDQQDDIRRYLPELRDYGTPIRIAHLLNHSSGLRNHMALAAFQPGTHLPSHAEALGLVFRQRALNFEPGTRHQYESPNYVLLAEIVERVSGMPFETFVTTRLLRPLRMTDSGYGTRALARAYQGTDGSDFVLNERVNGAHGSSGLHASVRDFAKWMINYDQPAIGGAPLVARMMSRSTLADGTPISYRYGLVKEANFDGVPGLLRISHGGQTAAYRSAFSWFPGKGFGTVVMCNHPADARAIERPIINAWMKREARRVTTPSAAQTGIALGAGEAAQTAGIYYDPVGDDVREFVVKDGQLQLVYAGEPYPLVHRGGGRFAFLDQGEMRFAAAHGGVVLTEALADQAVLSFYRLPRFDAQPLEPFAGRYRSTEVDGEIAIAVDSDGLKIRYPAGEGRVKAIAPDRFSGQANDFNHITFSRDPSGMIDGLTMSVSSGISHMRFARVAR